MGGLEHSANGVTLDLAALLRDGVAPRVIVRNGRGIEFAAF